MVTVMDKRYGYTIGYEDNELYLEKNFEDCDYQSALDFLYVIANDKNKTLRCFVKFEYVGMSQSEIKDVETIDSVFAKSCIAGDNTQPFSVKYKVNTLIFGEKMEEQPFDNFQDALKYAKKQRVKEINSEDYEILEQYITKYIVQELNIEEQSAFDNLYDDEIEYTKLMKSLKEYQKSLNVLEESISEITRFMIVYQNIFTNEGREGLLKELDDKKVELKSVENNIANIKSTIKNLNFDQKF